MNLHGVLRDFLHSKRVDTNPKTVAWYNAQLYRWVHWLNVTGADWLSADSLESYILERRADGLSENSIDGLWKALKVFFGWVKRRRPHLVVGRELPTDIVERPVNHAGLHRPRVADYDVVCAMIGAIEPLAWLDYRDRAIVQLMLSTGLRVSEVVAMRLVDVDVRDGFVEVYSGKGDKDRIVPFDADFKVAFVAWVYNRPVGFGDWLFIEADKLCQPLGQMSTNAVRKMLDRRSRAVGAKTVNPHSIRHLFATKALNDGVPLSAVSTMLGHTSVSFTAKVYARWIKRGLRREYDASWQVRQNHKAN